MAIFNVYQKRGLDGNAILATRHNFIDFDAAEAWAKQINEASPAYGRVIRIENLDGDGVDFDEKAS